MTASATASPAAGAALEELRFAPGYAALGAPFVEERDPSPLPAPHRVAFNPDVAALVGLRADQAERPEFWQLAAGNARFGAVRPFAAVYAGHQFGSWVPQLGDGRAITLGEVVRPDGTALEWQLKGAGVTAYSRFGDGRAVLRSTIREYLCSEAMAGLGIPTTRALAIAGSPETIYRETPETAAVLTRIAPSHLRFGTFEFFAHRGDPERVRTLADYAIARFYPEVAAGPPAPQADRGEPQPATADGAANAAAAGGADDGRYARLLRAVVLRTAELVAAWQAVGFAHGVLNTDNMSVLGLTLDYGPFGFLDAYDPGFICNHTDAGGRYAFDRQPTIGAWNLHALATALQSLVDRPAAEAALAAYAPAYHAAFLARLRAKLGLAAADDGDPALLRDLFALLAAGRVDYTRFFRTLSAVSSGTASADGAAADASDAADDPGDAAMLAIGGVEPGAWAAWSRAYRARLRAEASDDAARRAAMTAVNPAVVLRNYLAQEAIAAAESGDVGAVDRLRLALRDPFDPALDASAYAAPPPDWASHIAVSCSS